MHGTQAGRLEAHRLGRWRRGCGRSVARGCWAVVALLCLADAPAADGGELLGRVVDAATGEPLPARVYLEGPAGTWHFCESAAPEGSAWPYQEQWVPMPGSVEKHTTLSAHPFRAALPSGRYQITVERGKEFRTLQLEVDVGEGTTTVDLPLQRWIDMTSLGWYSGETHVHRRIQELPNIMEAEDLHVTFPVTFWTTRAYTPPDLEPSTLRRQGPSPFGPREDRGHEPIHVSPTRVIFPRNTEFEVFTVDDRPHLLGAIFVLNHRSVFTTGVPPVGPVARQAHAEGALLDLDKHSWPWSMMLVPIAQVHLFELANNSVWRTEFGFRQSPVAPADYMQVEQDAGGLTEWGWLDFGFQTYYALLNCGFRLQPTAGTASGVHPVPLGFSRVYVHLDRFSGESWIDGLRQGRSFVTTGPMLLARVNDQLPGHQFSLPEGESAQYEIDVEAVAEGPIERVELVVAGRIAASVTPDQAAWAGRDDSSGAHRIRHRWTLPLDRSTWLAVRVLERRSDGRVRFAHSAPWHVQRAGERMTPAPEQIDYLVGWMERELERNRHVLRDEAVEEFSRALDIYREIQTTAHRRHSPASPGRVPE